MNIVINRFFNRAIPLNCCIEFRKTLYVFRTQHITTVSMIFWFHFFLGILTLLNLKSFGCYRRRNKCAYLEKYLNWWYFASYMPFFKFVCLYNAYLSIPYVYQSPVMWSVEYVSFLTFSFIFSHINVMMLICCTHYNTFHILIYKN